MSGSSHIFIVCSPRPHAGKTLVARLITEFFEVSARPVSAYDLDPFEPALVHFLPAFTTHHSLNDTRNQMALFDRLILDDDAAKVIDLGHLALEKFFTIVADIDFARETRRHGIAAVVTYIADQTAITRQTYSVLREKFPDFLFMPVHNDAIARGPELRRSFGAASAGLAPLHIPQLSSALRTVVDRRPFSFADFRRRPPSQMSANQREELEAFLKRAFRELREVELALLMSNLNTTLAANLRETGTS